MCIIKIIDPTGKELTFVTNVMKFASEEIAWLYKRRWDIELFFKWIKQHCKIKMLIGHSENAVRLQMITGIITYLLFRLTWNEVPKFKSLMKGSTNWMGIWHPERWYVTSCDFSCMISLDMFEELVIEELEEELKFLDASVFHLDGPGAQKHLDRLLQIERLKGVQWVYDAGQPVAAHWLDVLKKIQGAGKCAQINVDPNELHILLENIEPEGMMYLVYAKSEEEARNLEKMVDDYSTIDKPF